MHGIPHEATPTRDVLRTSQQAEIALSLACMWLFWACNLNPRRVGPNFDLPETSTHAVLVRCPTSRALSALLCLAVCRCMGSAPRGRFPCWLYIPRTWAQPRRAIPRRRFAVSC